MKDKGAPAPSYRRADGEGPAYLVTFGECAECRGTGRVGTSRCEECAGDAFFPIEIEGAKAIAEAMKLGLTSLREELAHLGLGVEGIGLEKAARRDRDRALDEAWEAVDTVVRFTARVGLRAHERNADDVRTVVFETITSEASSEDGEAA